MNETQKKLYNSQINNVSITIDGNPNQLYSRGMQKHQQWDEIRKHFADGRHRTVSSVAKELELTDMKLADHLTTKYGLWLDMRSTDDDALHGSGRKIEDCIHIHIDKKAEPEGNLNAYIYYICNAHLIFEKRRLVNTVY